MRVPLISNFFKIGLRGKVYQTNNIRFLVYSDKPGAYGDNIFNVQDIIWV